MLFGERYLVKGNTYIKESIESSDNYSVKRMRGVP